MDSPWKSVSCLKIMKVRFAGWSVSPWLGWGRLWVEFLNGRLINSWMNEWMNVRSHPWLLCVTSELQYFFLQFPSKGVCVGLSLSSKIITLLSFAIAWKQLKTYFFQSCFNGLWNSTKNSYIKLIWDSSWNSDRTHPTICYTLWFAALELGCTRFCLRLVAYCEYLASLIQIVLHCLSICWIIIIKITILTSHYNGIFISKFTW